MSDGIVNERIAAATIHGRYLTVPPATPGPAPVLVGFHGYGEDAESQLARLQAIPGSSAWLIVSIQGLHRFYQRRTDRVVASWMTRQDRELAIADNIAYGKTCLGAVAAEWPVMPQIVFAGFSQGVAMAFRAAVNTTGGKVGVIACGGDIPPELTSKELSRMANVLIARGCSDAWHKPETFSNDVRRLRDCSVDVRALEFDGGHEWSGAVSAAASDYLQKWRF